MMDELISVTPLMLMLVRRSHELVFETVNIRLACWIGVPGDCTITEDAFQVEQSRLVTQLAGAVMVTTLLDTVAV